MYTKLLYDITIRLYLTANVNIIKQKINLKNSVWNEIRLFDVFMLLLMQMIIYYGFSKWKCGIFLVF